MLFIWYHVYISNDYISNDYISNDYISKTSKRLYLEKTKYRKDQISKRLYLKYIKIPKRYLEISKKCPEIYCIFSYNLATIYARFLIYF
jgi:hypothetical protein